MNAVICPDVRRMTFEANEMLRRQEGGTLHPGGRLEHRNGNVTLFMTYAAAQYRLRGLRLEHIRFVAPPSHLPALVHEVRTIARHCRQKI